MLVLNRRVGEEIVICDVIRVKILAVRNRRVKVGITAPQEVAVHRDEFHRRFQEMDGGAKWPNAKKNLIES